MNMKKFVLLVLILIRLESKPLIIYCSECGYYTV